MAKAGTNWWVLVQRAAAVLTILSVVGAFLAWLYNARTATIAAFLGALAAVIFAYVVVARYRWTRLIGASRPAESDAWVFVYGSLLDPESLGTTIGRSVALHHYRPGALRNHEKIWGAPVERVNMVRANWQPLENRRWSSLTAKEKDGATCYGAVVPVSDEELQQLHEREKSYDPSIVTESIKPIDRRVLTPLQRLRAVFRDLVNPGWCAPLEGKQIYTYIPRERIGAEGDCVRQRYLDMARKGRKHLILPDDIPLDGFPGSIEAFDADVKFASRWAKLPTSKLIAWNHTLHEYLRKQDCIRVEHDARRVIRTLLRPIVFSSSLHESVRNAAEELLKLSANTLEYVLHDTALAMACGFEPAELSLAKVEGSTAARLPQIARLDFVVSRSEVKLLEVNTDSPAGMAHLDAIAKCFRDHLDEMGAELCKLSFPKPDGVKKALAQAIRARWEEHCVLAAVPPSVAIVDTDVDKQPAHSEFEILKRYLAKTYHGDEDSARVCVCEPRHLDFNGKELTHRGRPIDVVYKRVLWRDLIHPGAGAEALLRAHEAGAVCVVNSLRSRLMGNKRFLAIMQPDSEHREAIWQDIDQDKCKPHLPEARELDNDRLAQDVIDEQDNWVLKSYRGFGAREVTIGSSADRNEWEQYILRALRDGGHIVQRVVPHGKVHVPMVNVTEVNPMNLVFIVGAYLVDGKCVGLEGKATFQPPVSMNPPHCGYRTVILSPAARKS